jgi:glycosyltransferase involved in cell wall biosynthesis
MIELTIGMATYNDYNGLYFTLQALRQYHDLENTELLVVDNYGCEHSRELVELDIKGRYLLAPNVIGTAAPRDLIFQMARGDAVLCCDCHVLFAPGVVARLRRFYRENPNVLDLLQGPLLHDDGIKISTHQDPIWDNSMWGVWATDPRGDDPNGEPFEIPIQGLGAFSCRRRAWLGFHPRFRGFGGEEGYIHEKFRRAGRRCLCLPWFRWMHRFPPGNAAYPMVIEDRVRNYIIGHLDLELSLEAAIAHFKMSMSEQAIIKIAIEELFRPRHVADHGNLSRTRPGLRPRRATYAGER